MVKKNLHSAPRMKQETSSPAFSVGQADFQREIWEGALLNFEGCVAPPHPTGKAAAPTLLLPPYNPGGADANGDQGDKFFYPITTTC